MFFGSYEGIIRKYFKNEKVVESLSFHSFYAGLPPALLPGHFAMIPYAEHGGIYYAKGGMIGIPKGFQKCGERSGMKVKLNAPVGKILIENKRVKGVLLEDGTEITAGIVVSNINAKKMYLEMVGEEHLPWLAKVGLKSYTYSMATPMLYLCLNYRPPLGTITPDDASDGQGQRLLERPLPERLFPEGTVRHTELDHEVRPLARAEGPPHHRGHPCAGRLPAGRRGMGREQERLKESIIDYLAETYLPGLKEHVVMAELSTPVDFERRLRSPEGAIYALRQDLPHSMMFRPSARSRHVKGLYLAGASTHPGGGVPTVTASAMIAADLIEKYEK
jgi:phytoene desaturase